jgi:hypothetical protein
VKEVRLHWSQECVCVRVCACVRVRGRWLAVRSW